ncbi:cupin [Blastococcus sp. TF02-09]|uniref:cupin domain-containing protein n=1 Tax=Blastococcus sp. TF02-09 TaxID=2250576 RepID=UPI000DEBD6B4|nr:cupin domain-containing protein [Blastococcus sp. TF02-9]RBY81280.1 cupin [Blastococcus sp. TF02-9]
MSFPDAPGYPPVRYRGERGERSGRLRPADTAPDLVGPATEIGFLATAVQTDGEFGLYRYTMTGPPTGPGPHFHRTISESFFVLSGTVQLYDGGTWYDATAGDFLHVPVGGVHAFRNAAGERADMLLLFAPGAPRETYFAANVERAVAGAELTEEERLAFLLAHDQFDA